MKNGGTYIQIPGFGGLLAIAFIVLKLCDKIDWSWWWVLSPLWIPPALVLAIVVILALCAAIVAMGAGIVLFVLHFMERK